MPAYKLTKCRICGMVWDPFPPEKLEAVYTRNYFINENPKGGYANYFEGMNINKKTFFERILRINEKVGRTDKKDKKTAGSVGEKRRMLDVGSALGDSLAEAKKLGWKKVEGVELSEYAAKESRKRGLKVKIGTLCDAKYSSDRFDVVTLQDVIEHVKSPLPEMEEVYRVLKPGGIVFLVTPDIGGWWARLLGPFWYHYKPGEHIMYFSQATLRNVLKKSKFKNIETARTYHIMSVEYVFNRLRYYLPRVFEALLKVSKNSFIGKASFRIYAGEIEAWGQK